MKNAHNDNFSQGKRKNTNETNSDKKNVKRASPDPYWHWHQNVVEGHLVYLTNRVETKYKLLHDYICYVKNSFFKDKPDDVLFNDKWSKEDITVNVISFKEKSLICTGYLIIAESDYEILKSCHAFKVKNFDPSKWEKKEGLNEAIKYDFYSQVLQYSCKKINHPQTSSVIKALKIEILKIYPKHGIEEFQKYVQLELDKQNSTGILLQNIDWKDEEIDFENLEIELMRGGDSTNHPSEQNVEIIETNNFTSPPPPNEENQSRLDASENHFTANQDPSLNQSLSNTDEFISKISDIWKMLLEMNGNINQQFSEIKQLLSQQENKINELASDLSWVKRTMLFKPEDRENQPAKSLQNSSSEFSMSMK